jgi:hypothetical protein
LKKTGGNAEVAGNKRVEKKAIRKSMKIVQLQIDDCEARKDADGGESYSYCELGTSFKPFYSREVEVRGCEPPRPELDGSVPTDGPPVLRRATSSLARPN